MFEKIRQFFLNQKRKSIIKELKNEAILNLYDLQSKKIDKAETFEEIEKIDAELKKELEIIEEIYI